MRKQITVSMIVMLSLICLVGCGNSAEIEALKNTISEKDAIIVEKDREIENLNNQINELNAKITDLQTQLETLQSEFDSLSAKVSSNTSDSTSSASNPYVYTPEEQQQLLDQLTKVPETPSTPAKEVTIYNCEVSTNHEGGTVYGTEQNPLTVRPDYSQLKAGDQFWIRTWGQVVLETYLPASYWE